MRLALAGDIGADFHLYGNMLLKKISEVFLFPLLALRAHLYKPFTRARGEGIVVVELEITCFIQVSKIDYFLDIIHRFPIDIVCG